jgi:hypothetical protein
MSKPPKLTDKILSRDTDRLLVVRKRGGLIVKVLAVIETLSLPQSDKLTTCITHHSG